MLDWSLLPGARLAVAVVVAGAVALVALLLGRARRWWSRRVPLAVGVALALTGVAWAVVTLSRLTAYPLPPVVWGSVLAGSLALALAGVRLAARPWRWRRLVALPLALVVLLGAGQAVNAHFGQYPTPRSALGLPRADEVDLAEVPPVDDGVVPAPEGASVASAWTPPADLPKQGVVAQVTIPGTVSGLAARPGWVWLPPAYLVVPRPLLPVLVLVNGQPGAPGDWLAGGRLAERMNAYAAEHAGLAPVVVVPDDLGGSSVGNPMCLDSALGNARTYLVRDVPDWITSTLRVDPDPAAWAFGGFSHGGTCAVQMAVTATDRYPTFLSISGEDEPRRGTRQQTVADAFGGDEAAFRAVNPRDVLAGARFPQVAGRFVVGEGDRDFRAQGERMFAAARDAGMDVELVVLPGQHGWEVWGPGLTRWLPWLGDRLRLTR
ncbi:hypothetical protein KCV87_03095 [Actinosynnema pretiosum subsp. pretiosum]|uniref:Esterase n=2 Tax=Actinosynnema TaxID=40566 RepID=A0AA45R4Z1_9PSEU|nr:alpha/beta hydrolase-fold protein [Actinosynnema mirum]ACU37293.1 putative esterase [Actinosynnema mirum DSM 43827]AXX30766.1 Apolipoprotein N-acyltransferase [Actinosynnema pretiosum subsp. pretiosum]QUF05118.1 hypothetical protein KCV87_03095 [Actinosynnema pretiosum subsp. pretiosum]